MPNHVYHYIVFTKPLNDKQLETLEKIVTNPHGICGHYKPMPEELVNTSAPSRIVSEEEYQKYLKLVENNEPQPYAQALTQAMSDELVYKYGYDNWYDWANSFQNWNTKWGCYDTELDDNLLRCTTAWSPFSDAVFEMFIKDFPDVEWQWDEEQGYGCTTVTEDGEIIAQEYYDAIEWSVVGKFKENPDDKWEQIICWTPGRLETMSTELVPPGFYLDYSEHEFIGETLPMEIYNQLTDEEREQVIKSYFK